MRRGWVIDLEKCIGCRSCMISCKQHNGQPPGIWWNRVFTPGSKEHMVAPVKGKEYFLPVTCQHCANPPCVKVCPVDATYKSEDGAVLIDFERCIGCHSKKLATTKTILTVIQKSSAKMEGWFTCLFASKE